MKTMMKRIAMFTLSACMLAGGAVSSFAAGASSHYTAAILSHQTDACEGTEKAELTVRFSSPYGDVQDYVICGECGDVNGESGLQEVDNAVANFSKLYVYQGKLDNGERVMTVSCLSSGASAMRRRDRQRSCCPGAPSRAMTCTWSTPAAPKPSSSPTAPTGPISTSISTAARP